MDIIKDLLEIVYNEITLPIINFIAKTPAYIAKIILFILIIALGYIISRFIDFVVRIVVSYIRLDNFFEEKKLENAFFKVKPSIYIRNLIKYYIYLYFVILGLGKLNVNTLILLHYLNIFYTILLIISIGFIVSAIIELYISKITERKIILGLTRGIVTYIFFVWSLEIVNLPTSIFHTILSIFLISLAISLGIFIGVILALEYKENIKKIIK